MLHLYATPGFLLLPRDWDQLDLGIEGRHLSVTADFSSWTKQFNASIPKREGNVLIGYSLGGRLAMHALIDAPKLWSSAIIISAHPGLSCPVERECRIRSDYAWADRFTSDPWEELITAWNCQPTLISSSAFERNKSDFSRKQLAKALRTFSLGRQRDLRRELQQLSLPILWVVGERDSRFSSLTTSISLSHPHSRIKIISNAAHRAPWDNPLLFGKIVGQFLSDCSPCSI